MPVHGITFLLNVSGSDKKLLSREIGRALLCLHASHSNSVRLDAKFIPLIFHHLLKNIVVVAIIVNTINAMHPAKRRRLDATASTLRKPFRSPMKVPADDPASSEPIVTNNFDQQRPDPSPPLASSVVHDSPTKSSRRLPSPNKMTLMNGPPRPIDEINLLQKQYSSLTQDLRRLRQDLDVAEQARKLHLNSQSQQLDRLISKWRDIARSAADEVFDHTSSKVKDMGGMRTWQKNTKESSQGWFDQGVSSQDTAYSYRDDYNHDRDRYLETTSDIDVDEDEKLENQQEVSCGEISKRWLSPNTSLAMLYHDYDASPDEH